MEQLCLEPTISWTMAAICCHGPEFRWPEASFLYDHIPYIILKQARGCTMNIHLVNIGHSNTVLMCNVHGPVQLAILRVKDFLKPTILGSYKGGAYCTSY